MDGSQGDRDRTFALAERATALMREYGPSATPRAYAVWYNYVAALYPKMNEAMSGFMATGAVSEAEIDILYEAYLDGQRLVRAADETSRTVLAELANLTEALDLSLGSSAEHSEALRTLLQDLDGTGLDRTRILEIVAALAATTREVADSNRVLEARMRESRNEIESLREALETTRRESLIDPLTGLSNRKQFEESLHALVEEAVAERKPASLVVIDVDFFKRFNDLYGHLTGDQVLRLVGAVMRETVTAGATPARFGGEEFAILLPGLGRAEARALAEKVRTSVMTRELVKRSTGETLGKITVSLGVAAVRPSDTAVSLLERADQCMFKAKRDGRNRTVDDGSVPPPVG
ncbi:GGDEF domain-containing protein [Methylobacterium gossipiicola]|nr:GGDEF domain-containing protein [Methylobacterium gossipiicola]